MSSSDEPTQIQKLMNPPPEELPDDIEMPIWDHLEELRERVLLAALASGCATHHSSCSDMRIRHPAAFLPVHRSHDGA
jgi:hypothetical protein